MTLSEAREQVIECDREIFLLSQRKLRSPAMEQMRRCAFRNWIKAVIEFNEWRREYKEAA